MNEPDSYQPPLAPGYPVQPPRTELPLRPTRDPSSMVNPAPDLARTNLSDWKDDARRDFEAWLATIEEIPSADDEPTDDEPTEAPDLYSFYAQFAAANTETRKSSRRTAEAMSQWGETLARFEAGLQPLREAVTQLAAVQPKQGRMSRAHCLILIELLDRIRRLTRAFETPPAPKRSWWGSNDDAWRSAWRAQHQALEILVSHLDGWLEREGVTRLNIAGKTFDPNVMIAVAAEIDPTQPSQIVLEEMTAGYLRDGELLRVAQVKVSR